MAQFALLWRSVTSSPLWLWVPVLGLGLAGVLAGPLPPGGLDALAKPAAARILHGSLDVGTMEVLAIAAVTGWMVLKPLAVIGAVLLLELRFNPPPRRRNLVLVWIAQACAVSIFVVAAPVINFGWRFLPTPLLNVHAAGSTVSLLFIQVPAFCLSLIIGGFFGYWFHRACHHFPLLWRFHSLHHSFELDALHNITHPVESVLGVLFISAPTALLIGVTSDQLVIITAFVYIQGYINHSRLPISFGPFRFLLNDNRYHFIHHSLDPAHFDKNFSNVPIWDVVFGTYVPAVRKLIPTGLADRSPPRTLWQYVTVQLPPAGQAKKVVACAI